MKYWIIISKCDRCVQMDEVVSMDLTPEGLKTIEELKDKLNANREQMNPVMEIERRD